MKGVRPGWAVKAIVVVVLSSLFFRCVSANNHTVGGETGWGLISNLQMWSSFTSFYTGDNLVFKYGPMHDVLEVNQMDYIMCRTIRPIATHTDGSTVVQLTSPGTRYFICGRRGHCARGLRLMIQVLPELTVNDPNAGAPSQPPSGNSPAPSPAAGGGNDDGTGGDHGIDRQGGGGRHHPPPSPKTRPLPPPPNPTQPAPPPPTPSQPSPPSPNKPAPPSPGNDVPDVPLPPFPEVHPPPSTPPCQMAPPPPPCNGSGGSKKMGMTGVVYCWALVAAWMMMTMKVF